MLQLAPKPSKPMAPVVWPVADHRDGLFINGTMSVTVKPGAISPTPSPPPRSAQRDHPDPPIRAEAVTPTTYVDRENRDPHLAHAQASRTGNSRTHGSPGNCYVNATKRCARPGSLCAAKLFDLTSPGGDNPDELLREFRESGWTVPELGGRHRQSAFVDAPAPYHPDGIGWSAPTGGHDDYGSQMNWLDPAVPQPPLSPYQSLHRRVAVGLSASLEASVGDGWGDHYATFDTLDDTPSGGGHRAPVPSDAERALNGVLQLLTPSQGGLGHSHSFPFP